MAKIETNTKYPAVCLSGAIACVWLLFACEPAPDTVTHGDITGHWFGARWEGSARVLWLKNLSLDGQFEVLFHTCYAGTVVRTETQNGVSELLDGVYRTTLERIAADGEEWLAGGDDEPIVYEYEILELTRDTMRYRSLDFGNRYEVKRVGDDFELSCPPARRVIDTRPGGRSGEDAWIRRGIDDEDDDTD